jgi:sugar diacid utilization regulator
VAVAAEGEPGIARALHELTGYPVAVEDRHGNLRAWAGPNLPEAYAKDAAGPRQEMLRRALGEGQPIRYNGRLVAVAHPREDVLGVLALIDPGAKAGDHEQVALEHGATVLAMELARLQSLAETELRLGRDLVEELLTGTDPSAALGRARALGHDLERRHRVLVVESPGREPDGDSFFHAVRRAARDTGVGSLLVSRGATVVVLSDTDHPWEGFRSAVLNEMHGDRCRIGVGSPCDRPADYPRSFREAQLSLTLQDAAQSGDRAAAFDELGVYQLFAGVQDTGDVERFVRQWLGALLDYDERKNSELAETLRWYLECGGAYDATATALSVHRSTLKYRLQRIREISGHDLADPDTLFNLQLASRAWQTLQALRRP